MKNKKKLIAGLFLAAALSLGKGAAWAGETTVSKGIYVQGIDCAGMTEEEVTAAVQDKVSQLGKTSVTLKIADQQTVCTLSELGLRWRNKEIMNEVLTLGATGNIVRRYKDQKDLQNSSREFALQFKLKGKKIRAYCKGLSSYNREPVNASIFTRDDLTPGVEGGTTGLKVDVDGAVMALKKAVQDWDGASGLTVEIPTVSTQPEVTYEELAAVKDVLGTATTDYSASSWARAVNVENGCRKISGTLIYPGDSFSVTQAVAPFTAENGYEKAPSYEENRVVDSYGGGICQVSTTLYNAVLKSELEVTARSNHTMVVGYVPLSKDAAIAEGVMDLAFVNTKDSPVYIIGYTYGGTITFTIYGQETRPSNRTLDFESRTIQTIEPSGAKLFANSAQNVGYIMQTQSQHTGYVAELWKNVYIDGVLSESVQVNSSTYTAVGTIYDIGVASSNPAVTQLVSSAIGTGSLANVQTAIANANALAAQQQAQQQSEQAQQQQQTQQQSEQAQQIPQPQPAQPEETQPAQPGGADIVIGEGGDVDESLSASTAP